MTASTTLITCATNYLTSVGSNSLYQFMGSYWVVVILLFRSLQIRLCNLMH